MKTLFSVVGGLVLGVAVGASTYLVLTSDDEEGLVHEVKSLANDVISEGKRAAEERRQELEIELGQQPESPV